MLNSLYGDHLNRFLTIEQQYTTLTIAQQYTTLTIEQQYTTLTFIYIHFNCVVVNK